VLLSPILFRYSFTSRVSAVKQSYFCEIYITILLTFVYAVKYLNFYELVNFININLNDLQIFSFYLHRQLQEETFFFSSVMKCIVLKLTYLLLHRKFKQY